MKKIIFAILFVKVSTTGFSQLIQKGFKVRNSDSTRSLELPAPPSESKSSVVYGRIEGNDTILIVYLPEVDIDLMNHYYQIAETRKGRRLIFNVRKVYPYAKTAGEILKSYEEQLAEITSNIERRKLMRMAEDEITNRYSDELKELTFSQGAILIRLIDRQTGDTSYDVVQELRGKVRAFFYQGFALLWGYDLKSQYDPKNNPEDNEIETIVTLLERGQI